MTYRNVTILSITGMIMLISTFQIIKHSFGQEFNWTTLLFDVVSGMFYVLFPLYLSRKHYSGNDKIKYGVKYGSLMLTFLVVLLVGAFASRVILLRDIYFSSPIPFMLEFFFMVFIALIVSLPYLTKNVQTE
jgi:hypothetical protein